MNPNLPTGETMNEGGMMPPTDGDFAVNYGGPNLEQCLPVDALKQPDEGEQMNAPEVGDEVTYTVTGKVTRVEGGHVYVMPSAVNGQDVKAETAAPVEPPNELEALEEEAKGLN